jgi:hypothetical protein
VKQSCFFCPLVNMLGNFILKNYMQETLDLLGWMMAALSGPFSLLMALFLEQLLNGGGRKWSGVLLPR